MNELIERLEALSGPCFAMEQEIYQAVHPEAWQRRVDDLLAGPMGPRLSPVDYSGYIKPPAYTASIDAAMTLKPEGWDYCISQGGNPEDYADVALAPAMQVAEVHATAATPAIAFCIAALKARSAMTVPTLQKTTQHIHLQEQSNDK